MKLFCVGCGPGDPELLTVKAVNLIKNAEIIFAPTAREGKPSIALSVVERYVDKFAKIVDLVFPMVKDRESLKDYWRRNADKIADAVRTEKRVIYLTVGDPALYSTWIYIHRELQKNHSDIEIDIVPGIASMFAFAAQAKMSLAAGDEGRPHPRYGAARMRGPGGWNDRRRQRETVARFNAGARPGSGRSHEAM